MHPEELKAHLVKLATVTDDEWMAGLSERKLSELRFHDRDRDRSAIANMDQDTYERFYGNKKYYNATQLSKDYVDRWLQVHVPGKVFLDYACGNGQFAIRAAKAGAALAVGIDISRVSIENARVDAQAEGVAEKTFFVQADAENTRLPDSCVDVIICSGMLHHLDLSYAFPELRRILAPSGRLLAVEALDYNPIIKLYRHLTPDMRTKWEKAHILSLKDLEFASRFFSVGDVRYWHITSMLGAKLPLLLPLLESLDTVLTRIPAVRLLSWIFTFELCSSKDAT